MSGNLPIPLTSAFLAETFRRTDLGSDFSTDLLALVTPMLIETPGGLSVRLRLSIHLIPEPATLALLGVGIVGLVAYGRLCRR